MRTSATNGQPYTYESLIQSLYLKETSPEYRRDKEKKQSKNGHKSGKSEDKPEQINNVSRKDEKPKKCNYCVKNGRSEVAHTHNEDKCYVKQAREKQGSKTGNKTEPNKGKFDTRKAINAIQESLKKVLKASKRKDVKLRGYSDSDNSDGESDEDNEEYISMIVEQALHANENTFLEVCINSSD